MTTLAAVLGGLALGAVGVAIGFIVWIAKAGRRGFMADAQLKAAQGEIDAKDDQLAKHRAGRGSLGGLLAGLRRASKNGDR